MNETFLQRVGDTFFLVAIEWGTREVVGLGEGKKSMKQLW